MTNLTLINQTQMQFLTQDYVTYANCIDYTQGLRNDYRGLAVFSIIITICFIIIILRNK